MRRRRRGKNLNFPTISAQGLLIFHQSFLHSTSGTCRFKHLQKIVIDITFFLIPIPEDNILGHLSLLSYPPSHTSTMNGTGLSVERKSNIKIDPPGSWWSSWPLSPWTCPCLLDSRLLWPQWLSSSFLVISASILIIYPAQMIYPLLPPYLQWACSTLNFSHSHGQNLPFDFLIYLLFSQLSSWIAQLQWSCNTLGIFTLSANPTVLFVCLAMPSVPHVLTCLFKFHGAST